MRFHRDEKAHICVYIVNMRGGIFALEWELLLYVTLVTEIVDCRLCLRHWAFCFAYARNSFAQGVKNLKMPRGKP